MKRVYIILALVFAAFVAQADLILEQRIAGPALEGTNSGKILIKGHMIRADAALEGWFVILDVDADEQWQLSRKQKTAQKVLLWKNKQTARYTNAVAANAKLPSPQSTGTTEKVNGYDTEIYTWTNSVGSPVRLWVAKDFPNFARIKKYLALLDRANNTGMYKPTPDRSLLPGMVLKWEAPGTGPKEGGAMITTTLVSAKEESIDASLFEVPKGYRIVREQ
jgi:hypothetical protein